jgi:EAL domain-containing protein (putative c-di-GMP-specific phosphodiesterase class I)
MSVEAWRRLEMEAELRRAIDGDQLEVHYQPVFDLTSERVVELEALVRWRHPERGILQPADFIPFAESTGLIVDIDRFVLDAACRQVQAWQDLVGAAGPLTVGVNLSAREFRVPGIVDAIARILDSSGLPASCLKVEITESVMMIESDLTSSIIDGLARLGVRIVIDDFGVGYSALAYLRRLAADTLKIDRMFVAGLGRSREDAAIVTATIALARALDLSVTAEGIETEEQASILRALGCDRGQGFLFSPPLAADRMEEVLTGAVRRRSRLGAGGRLAGRAGPDGREVHGPDRQQLAQLGQDAREVLGAVRRIGQREPGEVQTDDPAEQRAHAE